MKKIVFILSTLIISTAFVQDSSKDTIAITNAQFENQHKKALKADDIISFSLINFPKDSTTVKWDSEMKAAFTKTCVKGVKKTFSKTIAKEYCSCMLDKIIAKYPDPNDVSNLTDEETTQMAKECFE